MSDIVRLVFDRVVILLKCQLVDIRGESLERLRFADDVVYFVVFHA